MRYIYYCHGEISNSYISAVSNTLIKKLKEKYQAELSFNFTVKYGIAHYIIRAELEVKNDEELRDIKEYIALDEIRMRVIYKKWSKCKR